MGIVYRARKEYQSRTHQIVAELREAAGAAPPVDPYMAVKRKSAEISVLMALIHGGDWRMQVDHDVGLIVIARRRPRRSQSRGSLA